MAQMRRLSKWVSKVATIVKLSIYHNWLSWHFRSFLFSRKEIIMTLTRWKRENWDSARQLSSLREEIDRLFESPLSWFENASQPFSSGWIPAVDLYEDKDHVFVRAEVPGMKKEEIDISLHEGVL